MSLVEENNYTNEDDLDIFHNQFERIETLHCDALCGRRLAVEGNIQSLNSRRRSFGRADGVPRVCGGWYALIIRRKAPWR